MTHEQALDRLIERLSSHYTRALESSESETLLAGFDRGRIAAYGIALEDAKMMRDLAREGATT